MKLLMQRSEEESYVKIQHAVQPLGSVNILTFEEKYYDGASCRVRTTKFLCTLMRDADVPYVIEIST